MIPEFVFEQQWYNRSRHEMARTIQAMLAGQPNVKFSGLAVGKTYYDRPGHGGDRILTVTNVTPSGKQKDVRYPDGNSVRLHQGSCGGTFIEMSDDLMGLLHVTHEAVVAEAMDRGLEVAPLVRREYPNLFIMVPDRFAVLNSRVGGAERLVDILASRHPVLGPATLERMIDQENRRIAEHIAWRSHAHENSRFTEDVGRWIYDGQKAVDFLRWLQPHCEPGGVFYIGGSELVTVGPEPVMVLPVKPPPLLALGKEGVR